MIDHDAAMQAFRDAMAKLAVLGQDIDNMVDCSDLIPVPKPLQNAVAHFPAGFSKEDIDSTVCFLA